MQSTYFNKSNVIHLKLNLYVNFKNELSPVTEEENVNTSEGKDSSEDESIEKLWNEQVQICVKQNIYIL